MSFQSDIYPASNKVPNQGPTASRFSIFIRYHLHARGDVPANPPPTGSTGDSQSRKRKSGSNTGGVVIKQRTGADSSKARRTSEDEDDEAGRTGVLAAV